MTAAVRLLLRAAGDGAPPGFRLAGRM